MAYERVNWENLPSTNTPVNADNLNKMDEGIANIDTKINSKQDKLIAGTGIEITDKNTINNIQGNYSSNEQVIGKWDKGQTLYRRIIYGTLHVGRANVLASFPGSYRIANFNGNILQQLTNQVKPINFWFSTADYMQILHDRNNNNLLYDCAGEYEGSQIILVIEYIKE